MKLYTHAFCEGPKYLCNIIIDIFTFLGLEGNKFVPLPLQLSEDNKHTLTSL